MHQYLDFCRRIVEEGDWESRKSRQDRLELVFQCFSIDYERIPNGVR